MEITFNTQIVDVSVALNALKLYKAGNYKEAIGHLLDILDIEPRNWDARLMLAACYYKTAQYGAAQRAFRFLHDNSNDAEVKRKALEGLHATNNRMQKQKPVESPAEFGNYAARIPTNQAFISWLD